MYTVDQNVIVNKKISDDMDVITASILSVLDNVDAIFLTGGFGRSEGSVLVNGGRCQPLNDYDLVVITDSLISEIVLESTRLKLAEICGIRQVDLALKRLNDLQDLEFTMSNYDLIHASTMIYGSIDIKKLSPDWSARNLPLPEGVFPLFLFLSAIILSHPKPGLMSSDEIFWSYQQSTKSILGWGTAMLIFDGLYHPSYYHRNKIFQEQYPDHPELCKLMDLATQFKLRPTLSPIAADDATKFWGQSKDAHLHVMKILLSKYYKGKVTTWKHLIFLYRFSLKNIAKAVLSLLFRKHHYYDCHNTDMAKLYFCLSLGSKGDYWLTKSKQHYKRIKSGGAKKTPDFDHYGYVQQLILSDKNARIFYERGTDIFYD